MTLAVLQAAVFVGAGILLGLLHFAALHRAVSAHLQRHGPTIGLHSVRFAATTIGLLFVTREGGRAALLASFVGFVAARTFATLPRSAA